MRSNYQRHGLGQARRYIVKRESTPESKTIKQVARALRKIC